MNGYEIAAEQIKTFVEYQEHRYWDFLVDLSYKYDFEKDYIRENVLLTEYIDDTWEWNTDWCEGQTDVIVHGIICVDDVPKEV